MTQEVVDPVSGPVPGTAVAVRPLMPIGTVDEGKEQMARFQQECAAVLAPSDWQGPPGRPGSFVKKSGWRKLALRYGVSTAIVSRAVEHDKNGSPMRAEAVVRAIHTASGNYAETDGYCAVDEPRFKEPRGRLKLENDLRNTATTRAKNRAIADLVGFGQVSAEEMDAEDTRSPWGEVASENLTATFDKASLWLLGDDVEGAYALREAITTQQGDILRRAAAQAVALTALTMRKRGVTLTFDHDGEPTDTEEPLDAEVVGGDEPHDPHVPEMDPDEAEPVDAEPVEGDSASDSDDDGIEFPTKEEAAAEAAAAREAADSDTEKEA